MLRSKSPVVPWSETTKARFITDDGFDIFIGFKLRDKYAFDCLTSISIDEAREFIVELTRVCEEFDARYKGQARLS